MIRLNFKRILDVFNLFKGSGMKKIIHITFLLSDKTSAHSNADGFHANKKKIMLGNISHCF